MAELCPATDLAHVTVDGKSVRASATYARLARYSAIASRLAAVPLTAIADRTLSADQLGRVRSAVDAFVPVADRLAFLQPPFALEHVAAAGTAFGANPQLPASKRITLSVWAYRRAYQPGTRTRINRHHLAIFGLSEGIGAS